MIFTSTMVQQYKSVYYSDYSDDPSSQKSLTLAFGKDDETLYKIVQSLSSHEIRNLLGYQKYVDLKKAAEKRGTSINSYCLKILRQKTKERSVHPSQLRLPGFLGPSKIAIDPLQATFRGGEAEPLHLWYPLLEGYSPRFVETIISHYSTDAKSVIDPFSGTGTTPLTAAKLGLQAYYCEVNPLLQFLTDAKVKTYRLSKENRDHTRYKLEALIDEWPVLLDKALPSSDLDKTYSQVFRTSEFFDDGTYNSVLKARSVLDRLSATGGLVADLLSVAILASLIPSSRLIRSGDIRYRTKKEQSRKVAFESEVSRRLELIASDIAKLDNSLASSPTFLCEDARNLGRITSNKIDLAITSPPYLNGTNYFRNTKMELWFLRCLKSKQDLADFRYRAVTAGINDVTVDKVGEDIPEPVTNVLNKLEETAYDVRIPRMVLSYFQDMKKIFGGMKKHLSDGATVAIDLGDSVYGGVHVPTDKILIEVLDKLDYKLQDQVILRKRLSRDKTELHQVLLVMRHEKEREKASTITERNLSSSWEKEWVEFKEKLPHQKHPFSKRNWGSGLHSLCSYQGKMKPSLAHHLAKVFVPQDGRMLDPFVGVGTIPFEAALKGSKTYSFEISPAAFTISAAKLALHEEDKCENLIKRLKAYIECQEPTQEEIAAAQEISFNGNLTEYFHKETLREVLLSRRFFLENPAATGSENLVLASLLHILHGNRPYALSRKSHPITPYKPSGPSEYRALIPRLRKKVKRSLNVGHPETFVPGEVFFQDATQWWPHEVDNLDAIITSPPFFDSTRFYVGNWMRLWFCGWERKDFDVKPPAFVEERQKKSFDVYTSIFQQARERLRPGGVVVLHLGLSHKSDMAKELSTIAKPWFKTKDIFVEDVTHLESHGIRDKGSVTGHQYLILS